MNLIKTEQLNPIGYKSECILVTPQMATNWLNKPFDSQRSISRQSVDELCGIILNSQWKLIPDGVMISPDGYLLNARHRLTAIVETEKSVPMYVYYDVPPEVALKCC